MMCNEAQENSVLEQSMHFQGFPKHKGSLNQGTNIAVTDHIRITNGYPQNATYFHFS